MTTALRPRFTLGRVLATPSALDSLWEAEVSPLDLLTRHVTGDWGDLDDEDKRANEQALVDGSRLLSAYRLPLGTKLWVITEADRSATTILLPEEY